ncbi:UDP-N-acetylmuramoyl-L-alanyl-D-glutamate--2,6-diaminopimelate ligase [Papillibacter cinnamivorans]|uniref:UDP-N-acetylmuramoyl-L-alanyl-D-glutamate--2, 6-diaminopimelate ligase n=1 Tax=Papillibacter cinnamivorans TaxID=100176 RepID=UPI0009FFE478|nr:UDP-N-acetylmuramoyl-L-alanyl-D-glutamate--2,6-diaminopimelate ligase [Papillibacter cinnamivorans]
MKLKELLRDVVILSSTADMETEIHSVCYDSRKVSPGDLFVAIEGFETDGHAYIPRALEAGAAAVVCQKAPEDGVPHVMVSSSRRALAVISANFFGRPAEKMKFIGITGTNGKTTTTYLAKRLLEQALGARVGLIGTNQNLIGERVLPTERTTPESFELQRLFREMLDAGCTHVVMEVSSHALVLERVYGVFFETGIFTNLTQDHLDFHKTMEAYMEAKAILFQNCRTGIINLDDPWAGEMIQRADCEIFTFSESKNEADLVAKNIRLYNDRVEFEAVSIGMIQRMEVHIPGSFTVYNALGVIALGLTMGIDISRIAAVLKQAGGVKGRMEVVPAGTDYTVLIDYAHTPDALENLLRSVKGFARGRVVALFGCGGDRDPIKRPIMGNIAAELADFVIVTSDNPRTEEPGAIIRDILKGMEETKTPHIVIENRPEAIRYAMDHALPDDIVVLAGKGHEDYQIIGKEKHHLDEREVIAAHLAEQQGKNS